MRNPAWGAASVASVPDEPAPLSGKPDQLLQLGQGLLQVPVHQAGIELAGCGQLDPGPFQPAANRLFTVGAAATDAPLQLLKTGGLQKHLERRRKALTHLAGPLQFDLQQHRSARGQLALHRLARRAIEIAGELSPLQQAPLSHLALKAGAIEEEITAALLLTRPGTAGGG